MHEYKNDVCMFVAVYLFNDIFREGAVSMFCWLYLLFFVHMLKIHTYLIICINREHMQISRLKNISIKY